MKPTQRIGLYLVATALPLGLAACGGKSSSRSAGTTAAATTSGSTATTSGSTTTGGTTTGTTTGGTTTGTTGGGSTGSTGGGSGTTSPAPLPAPTGATLLPGQGFASTDTPVVVTGTGLLRVSAAALVPDQGGTPNAIAWVASTDTTANAVVPAGLPVGDYRLELTHAGGVVRAPLTFEVLPAAPPTLVDVTPFEGTNDVPHVVTITGTGFVSSMAVTVGSATITSLTRVSSTELRATIPAGVDAGSNQLAATHAGGTSSGGPDWFALNLADPDAVGAYEVGYRDVRFPGASGDRPDMRYYYPAQTAGSYTTPLSTAGPYPVVILNHGFKPPLLSFGISFRNNSFLAGWLASHGYVVACVDLATNNNLFGSGQANSQRDADDTLAALDYLEAAHADAQHPLFGLLDAQRAAFVGHSRGGDGAIMAASAELLAAGSAARVRAVVAMGPPSTDSQNGNAPLNFGVFDLVPALLIGGTRDGVAPFSHQLDILSQAGSPAMALEIEGANHSQYKDNDSRIWGDDRATISLGDQHDVVRRYVTAWLGTHVKGQAALFADYVMQGSELQRDARLLTIDTQ